MPTNLLRLAPGSAQYSPAAIAALSMTIRRTGILAPILIDEDRVIVSGQGLFLAAKRVGLHTVPVVQLNRRFRNPKH
jgi:ParB-like chromosome segregation protein Spo0J